MTNSIIKSKIDENTVEIEDIFDLEGMEERIEQIENCEPLRESWVKETLVNNLK